MRRLLGILLVSLGAGAGQVVLAQDRAPPAARPSTGLLCDATKNVLLRFGPNSIDLTGWGHDDLVMHGLQLLTRSWLQGSYSFYLADPAAEFRATYQVPIVFGRLDGNRLPEPGKLPRFEYQLVDKGDEWSVQVVHLIVDHSRPAGPALIVLADKLDQTTERRSRVRVRQFALVTTRDEPEGSIIYYFELKRTSLSARRYDSVDDARAQELHLT